MSETENELTGREPMLKAVEPVLCFVRGTYAYFTTQALDEQWGDDWNDAPYEHNAGTPYEYREREGVLPYRIVIILWDGEFETPADIANGNSHYSVEMINRGDAAWLRPEEWNSNKEAEPIHAGVSISEFKRLIWLGGGRIFVEEAAP
jgi:hypothetical protein